MYTVQTRRDVFTQDTTIRDNTFGGWIAVNTGASNVEVLGISLAPGERLDYSRLHPDVVWTSPIFIKCSGSQVTLIRMHYKKLTPDEEKKLTK